ncbi:hypothetical protein POM88_003088 [Heracleum sosnowskyi]|uniref:PORR domain-containing protein n=1 Tax=Heracleum sosnowskyi TaxID=360622 RepID=A0AAD8JHY0_9APIA|nr:hypothetical protein POM88_003088 [Heracleum sosnowskyi]
MTREKTVHFQSFYNLKWDLGLPDDFDRNLIRKYPDCFRVVKGSNGVETDGGLKENVCKRVETEGDLNGNVKVAGETENEKIGVAPKVFDSRAERIFANNNKDTEEVFHALMFVTLRELIGENKV